MDDFSYMTNFQNDKLYTLDNFHIREMIQGLTL